MGGERLHRARRRCVSPETEIPIQRGSRKPGLGRKIVMPRVVTGRSDKVSIRIRGKTGRSAAETGSNRTGPTDPKERKETKT